MSSDEIVYCLLAYRLFMTHDQFSNFRVDTIESLSKVQHLQIDKKMMCALILIGPPALPSQFVDV